LRQRIIFEYFYYEAIRPLDFLYNMVYNIQ